MRSQRGNGRALGTWERAGLAATCAAAVLGLLSGCTRTAPSGAAPQILYGQSLASNGSGLDGATVSGAITVYVDDAKNSFQEVDFYVDDSRMQGTPEVMDTAAPFEMMLDTTTISNGQHTLTADVVIGRGGNKTKIDSQATFTVANGSPSSVSISPTSVSLPPGGSTSFTATVSNASNTGVTWSADGGGTVSGTGNTVTYTAPAAAGTYHVTATSEQDPSKSATAVVTVASSGGSAGVPRPDHVVVVIEENHVYSDIYGSTSAPYMTGLADRGAMFTQSYAIEHPSEPNYLDLFSGSNQGVTDDSCPHTFTTANLANGLLEAGFTFAAYSEDLPGAGSTVCSYQNYARKHAPWVNWPAVPGSTQMPFSSFPTDYATLPDVSFVIPNLDDDMHDGSVSQGDTWLENNIGGYAQWAETHNSLLVVTFDEGSGSNQRIYTVFYGQNVTRGSYSEHIDHFDVLRTLEDMYGLSPMGASSSATPITDVWGGG